MADPRNIDDVKVGMSVRASIGKNDPREKWILTTVKEVISTEKQINRVGNQVNKLQKEYNQLFHKI